MQTWIFVAGVAIIVLGPVNELTEDDPFDEKPTANEAVLFTWWFLVSLYCVSAILCI